MSTDDIFSGHFLPLIWIFSFCGMVSFIVSITDDIFIWSMTYSFQKIQHRKAVFGQWHFGKHLPVATREGHIHLVQGNRLPRKSSLNANGLSVQWELREGILCVSISLFSVFIWGHSLSNLGKLIWVIFNDWGNGSPPQWNICRLNHVSKAPWTWIISSLWAWYLSRHRLSPMLSHHPSLWSPEDEQTLAFHHTLHKDTSRFLNVTYYLTYGSSECS